MMEQKLNRTERRKEETRQRIYQVALKLFMEKGYDQTSVDEIVRQADVAKGTFFYHFPKKEAILAHLGQKRIDRIKEMFREEAVREGSAYERITAIFRLLGQLNEAEPEETKLIVVEGFRHLNEIDQYQREIVAEFVGYIVEILLNGQEQGEIAADINPDQAARTIMGIYFFTLLEWAVPDYGISLTEDLIGKITMVYNGLRGRGSHG